MNLKFNYILVMKKFKNTSSMIAVALSLAVSAFAQVNSDNKFSESLDVPKNIENYNEFQIEKWGPVTYRGEGKCDILDLYQKNVKEGLGYSTIVDYHSKQAELNGKFSCVSWGLGLTFKVEQDTSVNSEDYELTGNLRNSFSARGKNAVKKFFVSDSTYLELESVSPVSLRLKGKCYAADFLATAINESSGYHGIVDLKANEIREFGEEICTFWGLAARYKRREVVEKVVTEKRIIEVIKLPPPKPDTVYVPEKTKEKGCCIICNCDR